MAIVSDNCLLNYAYLYAFVNNITSHRTVHRKSKCGQKIIIKSSSINNSQLTMSRNKYKSSYSNMHQAMQLVQHVYIIVNIRQILVEIRVLLWSINRYNEKKIYNLFGRSLFETRTYNTISTSKLFVGKHAYHWSLKSIYLYNKCLLCTH